MRDTYLLMKTNMTAVNLFSRQLHASEYIDPSLFQNVTAEYVYYGALGQTWQFFAEYDKEVRELLTISTDIQDSAAKEVFEKNIVEDARNYLCIHIRRTDFEGSGSLSKMDPTTAMASAILIKHVSRSGTGKIAIFGDDQPFMKRVVDYFEKNNMTRKGASFVSNLSVGMDLHMAKRICKVFIITAPVSTFGFFFGYLTEDQESVYYRTKNEDDHMGKPIIKEIFPPTWKSLAVNNDSTVTIE